MKIGLVLGGGGARGLAHIGVLEVLLERGYEPVAIAGCSMGGIIGALFASGKSPAELYELFDNLPYLKLADFGTMGAIIGGKGIESVLSEYLPETFAELHIPLTVTAVDVQEGQLVVLNQGNLVSALRATSALPGLIAPQIHNGKTLIDGGLLNNLPTDLIRTMTPYPVIAVDVAAPANRHLDFEHERKEKGWRERFSEVLSGDIFNDMFKRFLTIELFMKSFDVPQKVLTETRLAMNPPDLLLRPDLPRNLGVEDFTRFHETYQAGIAISRAALDDADLVEVLQLSA